MAYPTPISAHRVDFTGAKFIANRSMVLDGKRYHPGDAIPDGLIPPRRARQMFEQRKITIELAVADAPADNARANKPAKCRPARKTLPETPAETPAQAPGGAGNPVGGYTIGNGYKAVHRHFGNWDVIGPDGRKISGPHKRAQIEHLIA